MYFKFPVIPSISPSKAYLPFPRRCPPCHGKSHPCPYMLRQTQFLHIERVSVTCSKVHANPFQGFRTGVNEIIFSNTCHNISFPFNTWNVIAPVEFRKCVPGSNKDGPSGSHIKSGICRVGWPGAQVTSSVLVFLPGPSYLCSPQNRPMNTRGEGLRQKKGLYSGKCLTENVAG